VSGNQKVKTCRFVLAGAIFCSIALGQEPPAPVEAPLTVDVGVPLRLYITQRLSMRTGQSVRAKLIEPVFAFDRIVLPAGAEVEGRITRLDPAPKMVRIQAMLNGDFTPLHKARVQFNTVLTPDGQRLPIHTLDSIGLGTIALPGGKTKPSKKKPAKAPPPSDPGVLGTARQQARDQINGQINARTRGLADLVRGPNKMERLEDFLLRKLPYHPQWYARGTRFDAVLQEQLAFGNAAFPPEALRSVGSQPPADTMAHIRLLSAVNSVDARVGDKVDAVLSEPLVTAENKLILPAGARLTGAVQQARAARWFHRSGQLRFRFEKIEVPEIAGLRAMPAQRTEAQLTSVESDPRAGVKVDAEGGVKATESKARLLGPVIAILVASKSLDDDAGRHSRGGVAEGGSNNSGGRALGGFSGFGLLGSALSRGPKVIGGVLGFYGLGWSVYSTIVSRGKEVEFQKNTAMEIRFGSRTDAPNLKGSKPLIARAQ
jgi:hypothetical protein